MSIRFRLLVPAVILASLAAPLFLAGCGDDEVAPPPPRYAPIVVFNGVADIAPAAISFKIGETTIAANAPYGAPTNVLQALVGSNTEVKALSPAGSEIGKAGVNIDTNRSVWVIASGFALTQQAAVFGVSAAEPAVPSGRAAIRAIHASSNLTKVDVRLTDALGSKIATGMEYKKAGDFTSIDTTVRTLSITRADNSSEVLLVNITPALQAGRIYNLVIFGSTTADSSQAGRLQAKIVQEP